jgi:2-succinyl-5-enolpyruvyl-6-hydroxy-3-cyclohexene-1-carboxylate synthase
VDERSAGFFALGLSQQSRLPTALICTSGSALLNYYPAVAEAFYSRIPLVVISADRPPYKIDIGDGQTIRQPGVFEKHIGFEAALVQDLTHSPDRIREEGSLPGTEKERLQLQGRRQLKNETLISKALQTALDDQIPVHLNAPFEEPLYQIRETPAFLPERVSGSVRHARQPDWETLRVIWERAGKKMVLIGSLPPGCLDTETLEHLAADPSVLVFTETTSNIHHSRFFPSIDSIMAPLELSERSEELFRSLQPDLLLTLGGMVVSKKIKQFLRKYTPGNHWHVDPFQAPDTYYALKKHIEMPANAFLRKFLSVVSPGSYLYRDFWDQIRNRYEEGRQEYLRRIPFSDMVAFDRILNAIPAGIQVQLANSSTVRYAQLFDMGPENPVYCNRGTSGIEGSTSTAVGASINAGQPVLLITGDLSFFYDTNGLWNKYLRADFRMVVINNQGGGIFRILPGKETGPTFENFFETVQDRSIKAVCDLYGIEHRKAETPGELSAALQTFFDPSQAPLLLEVKTPRKLNDEVLLGYFDFLSSALGATLRKIDFHE